MADEEELEDDELDDEEWDDWDGEWDDWDHDDETIPVCPECGSDDLEVTGQDLNGDDEYECNDCGETFGAEDLEEEE